MEGRGPLIASAIVCLYCSKHGHTVDKCHAISKLKGEQSSDGNSGSGNSNNSSSSNSNSSSNTKKPPAKSKKNTFSVKIAGTSILAASAASSFLGRSDAWLLDSGANASSCNSRELFTEMQGYSGEIMTMSGDSVAIKGRGTASIGKGCNDIGIDNVLYTPDAAISLLSVHRLAEGGLDVLFRKGHAFIYQGDAPLMAVKARNGLFPLTADCMRDST
ncbi:hypothetical protein IWW47_002917, partial [Coemansia sp. RSA 2052]